VGRNEARAFLVGNRQKKISRNDEWIAHGHLSRLALCRHTAVLGLSFH
jgi:hypothetical protein